MDSIVGMSVEASGDTGCESSHDNTMENMLMHTPNLFIPTAVGPVSLNLISGNNAPPAMTLLPATPVTTPDDSAPTR